MALDSSSEIRYETKKTLIKSQSPTQVTMQSSWYPTWGPAQNKFPVTVIVYNGSSSIKCINIVNFLPKSLTV